MRNRLIAAIVIVVAVVAATVVFLVQRHSDQQRAIKNAPVPTTVPLTQVATGPRIVFTDSSRAYRGRVAMVSLADPSGPRGLTSSTCERTYADEADVLCLYLDRASISYDAEILDAQFHSTRSITIAGIPSRARFSPDGTLAATTTFIGGDSYAAANLSTRTIISAVTGPASTLNLEDDFSLIHQGKKIAPVDRNFWGVTFAADDNLFYATVAFGGNTWLVKGDLKARTMTTMNEDAECPSLSPDGTTLVYKKRLGQAPGHWRLTALNLATGVETKLAEPRSVDDQVEWLDDSHVLYAVPESRDPYVSDVYSVPSDGHGSPTLLIAQASSPAVVR
jgi:hypothetical protein